MTSLTTFKIAIDAMRKQIADLHHLVLVLEPANLPLNQIYQNGEGTTGVSIRGMEIRNIYTSSNHGIDLLQQPRKSKKGRRLLAIREVSSESIHRMEGTD
jgi:hypothetical protein